MFKNKFNQFIISKIIEPNESFINDIYHLKENNFISTNDNKQLVIWTINEKNNMIYFYSQIKNFNFISIDKFNENNFFIIENNIEQFIIRYFEFKNKLISLLFLEKKNYPLKYIFEDINKIIENEENEIEEKDKEMLNFFFKKFNCEDENENNLFEINRKFLDEIDNKFMTLFEDINYKFLKENDDNYFINTNLIINKFINEIKNKKSKCGKEEKIKINYLLNFSEICNNIRKLYSYRLLISDKINNVYNLNNEYLLFMGQQYLFIKYSLLESEFLPVVTNNFLPCSLIDYKDYEINNILQDKIILNNHNDKIFYIIDLPEFLIHEKYYSYHSFIITNDKYLFFDEKRDNQIQFTVIPLQNFINNEHYQNIKELFNFKIEINPLKLLTCNNNEIFINLYEQNQLSIVNFNIINLKIDDKKNKNINEIKLKQKNSINIIPESYNFSGIYSKKYHISKLFSEESYYCSNLGSKQSIFFKFDDEYYFVNIKLVFHSKYLDCRPKDFNIEICDKEKRIINSLKFENENKNEDYLTNTITIGEKGKYIGFNIFDNYGGDYIILKEINFYININNIIVNPNSIINQIDQKIKED